MADGRAAIEYNRQALIRILAGIAAMAGLAGFALPLAGGNGLAGWGKAEPSGPGEGVFPAACPHPEVRADPEPVEGEPRRTLPRRLHCAVLRLLRPAEAAARRLIIAMARGLVVTLPPPRPRKPKPKPKSRPAILRGRVGTGIILPPGMRSIPGRKAAPAAATRPLVLPLADRMPLWPRRPRRFARVLPRICTPGFTPLIPFGLREPARRKPPTPDDQIDATRLSRRMAALSAALGDLPGQARRFARWRALRERALRNGRFRNPPLKPGRPPGGRLWRYDPAATPPRNVREIDEVLAHANALAFDALYRHDTS